MNSTVEILKLGMIRYKKAWDLQNSFFDEFIQYKKELKNGISGIKSPNHKLIICEHPPVITLGKSGTIKNLLLKEDELRKRKIDFHKIDRGGDITFHGPGQLVVYPIFDLEQFSTDLTWYLRSLEEVVMETMKAYGLISGRIDGLTGVWLDSEVPLLARKICAMGIRTSRWVSKHGIALNANTDMKFFEYIIPCGIQNYSVTSMQKELKESIDINELTNKFINNFKKSFKANYMDAATIKE